MTKFELSPSNNDLPGEPNDSRVLSMWSEIEFDPDPPSGAEFDGDEAQAMAEIFADNESSEADDSTEQLDLDTDGTEETPLSPHHDAGTGDPKVDRAILLARTLNAIFPKKQ